MNRREFIEWSAAGALASASSAAGLKRWTLANEGVSMQRERAGQPSSRLKKSLKFGMIHLEGGSLESKFRLAKECGFDGVEMDSPNSFDAAEVAAARDAAGISIPGVVDSIHWSKPLSDPDPAVRAEGLRGLEQAIRDCKRYGGTTVLLVPAVVSQAVAYDEAYRRSQEEIRKALPLAAESGVRIAIENVWNNFLLSPMEAARYIDDFESDAIGWYFDVGNIVNYGWPEQWIRILGRRILKLDIKEFSRKRRNEEGLWNGFNVEIGEGDCNWPAVMDALQDIGYHGWASAEVSGGGRERLMDIARRMDSAFGG